MNKNYLCGMLNALQDYYIVLGCLMVVSDIRVEVLDRTWSKQNTKRWSFQKISCLPHHLLFFNLTINFFPSSQHNFWKKFCVLLFNAIYYQHTKFFLKFLLGTWKKIWLWGWRKANGAVHMIFSRNIISLVCCLI